MKPIVCIAFCIVFILCWSSTSCANEALCPAKGDEIESSNAILLPVPGDCSAFYICAQGKLVLFHCKGGLLFNPILKVICVVLKTVIEICINFDLNDLLFCLVTQVCDWPQNVQCDSSETSTQTTATASAVFTTSSSSSPTTSSGLNNTPTVETNTTAV